VLCCLLSEQQDFCCHRVTPEAFSTRQRPTVWICELCSASCALLKAIHFTLSPGQAQPVYLLPHLRRGLELVVEALTCRSRIPTYLSFYFQQSVMNRTDPRCTVSRKGVCSCTLWEILLAFLLMISTCLL